MSMAATNSNGIERRGAPRTAFGKPVVGISMVDREPLSACVVDVSRTGACLLFAADVHVPAVFTIDFGNMLRHAQVMWHREALVGVKFTDASPRAVFEDAASVGAPRASFFTQR